METPITFVNRNGCRLFGMLHRPERATPRRVGVLISVNAIKYRLGTFRLHVLLARRLCELGYFVFSFDPQGIGDSEGEFEFKLLSEHYYDIQTGKYNEDLSDAVDYFTKSGGLDSVVVFGLCGGAISVLMEGGTDSRIDGMILLNIPVLVEDRARFGQADNAAKITSSKTAGTLLKQKLSRILEVNFWRRLIRREVDLAEEGQLVLKSFTVLGRRLWERARSLIAPSTKSVHQSVPVSSHRLFNMHFQRAFGQALSAHKQLLFVFAELDPWTWIFKSEFQDAVLGSGSSHLKYCEVSLVAAANHIFSGSESQKQLESCVVNWLENRFSLTLTPT
jgi:pimeloyl-ACP methyl ester carboxylesterase